MNRFLRFFSWKHARTLLVVLTLSGIAAETAFVFTSPSISLLSPRRGGEWIRPNDPVILDNHRNPDTAAIFRKQFLVESPGHDQDVAITAFKRLTFLSLDGQPMKFSAPPSWKQQIRIRIPGHMLTPGSHELRLGVVNRMAPPLIHVTSTLRGLGAANGWEKSTLDGNEWRPVLRADEQRTPTFRESFPTSAAGLRSIVPVIVPLFLGILLLTAFRPGFCRRIAAPESVRLLLLVSLLALGVNNMLKLGTGIMNFGFDAREHLDYVFYLLEKHSLPLATEGWQMFQPPLYYTLSAALLLLLNPIVPAHHSHFILGIIPLACLLLLVEISYRTVRELFPESRVQQSCGLFVAGLLPMNIYMCHFVGNEPLNAVFSALVLLMAVKYLKTGKEVQTRDIVLWGAMSGLALLSKVTLLILIPVMCAFILLVPRHDPSALRGRIRTLAIYLFSTALVAGWFFLRNWIRLGKPFYGGWDPSRKIVWWQEPGYRVMGDYISFGESLRQPVYAVFNSFGDALYATFWGDGYNVCEHLVTLPDHPHWNYGLLAAGIALSLIPALSMAAGTVLAFWRSGKPGYQVFTFLLAALGIYFAALIHLFSSLPIFSTVKASYTMGLTPCYAVMVALGSGLLAGKKYAWPLYISLLVTWGIITYAGFFII